MIAQQDSLGSRLRHLELLILLGALQAFAPLSIDMYLPAMPVIEKVFHTSTASVQMTMVTFLLGYALGQPLYGPITDRFGRKPPLYASLLVFYPADETTLCTQQLCEFRDSWALVQSKDAVVLGINPAKEAKHALFRANHDFPFALLADPGQRVGADYRAKGLIVKRTVYLIGRSGKIRYARRGKPVPEEVLAAAEDG
ncbi:MAG: MFS transporter [Candidatus Acidiferrum sp.]